MCLIITRKRRAKKMANKRKNLVPILTRFFTYFLEIANREILSLTEGSFPIQPFVPLALDNITVSLEIYSSNLSRKMTTKKKRKNQNGFMHQ